MNRDRRTRLATNLWHDSREFTQLLQDRGVKMSMDGKGRYVDDIFVERLWRTAKYEEVYLKAYANAVEARRGLGEYFRFYNDLRPHQAPPVVAGGRLWTTGPRQRCSTKVRWTSRKSLMKGATVLRVKTGQRIQES